VVAGRKQLAAVALAAGLAVGIRRLAEQGGGEAFGQFAFAEALVAGDQQRLRDAPLADIAAKLAPLGLLPGQ